MGAERGDRSLAALDIAQGFVANDFEERSSIQSALRGTYLLVKSLMVARGKGAEDGAIWGFSAL